VHGDEGQSVAVVGHVAAELRPGGGHGVALQVAFERQLRNRFFT
jgi:hypothetical protein